MPHQLSLSRLAANTAQHATAQQEHSPPPTWALHEQDVVQV
jgi:hypothetical protein